MIRFRGNDHHGGEDEKTDLCCQVDGEGTRAAQGSDAQRQKSGHHATESPDFVAGGHEWARASME